jgi:hypothetical protein
VREGEVREPRWEDEAPCEPDEGRLSWAERIEVAASYTREERRTAKATEHARYAAGRRAPDSPRRDRPTPRQRALWARQGARLADDTLRQIKATHAALRREARGEAPVPTLPTGAWRLPVRESRGSFAAAFRARREARHLGALADVPRGCMFGVCRAPATRQHRRTHRWYCAAHWARRAGAGRAPTAAG